MREGDDAVPCIALHDKHPTSNPNPNPNPNPDPDPYPNLQLGQRGEAVECSQPILFKPQLAQVGEAAQGERVKLPDLVPIERELA